jgi:hypothetical protein
MQTKFLEWFLAFTPLSFRHTTEGLKYQTIHSHKYVLPYFGMELGDSQQEKNTK